MSHKLAFFACFVVLLAALPLWAAPVQVFWIGDDNGSNSDFDHENAADDHYYWEDGNYSTLGTGASDWNMGRAEIWKDGSGSEGMERALVSSPENTTYLYFQLDAKESIPTAKFSFTSDHVGANGTHDVNYGMNGSQFHSETNIGNKFVTDTFTGADVGAAAGPNYIKIEKTDSGGWIQFDYLSLEVTAPQLSATPGSGSAIDFGYLQPGQTGAETFGLENVGTAGSTVDVLGYALGGPDAGLLSLPGDPTGTYTGGAGPSSFAIDFLGSTTAGQYLATLTLNTQDENGLAGSVAYDLSAIVTPEPGTLLIWAGLAGLGIGVAWRRRRG